MWYWDYTPSSWGRPKPLTKAQLRKIQEAYSHADEISAEVRQKEEEEQRKIEQETKDILNLL